MCRLSGLGSKFHLIAEEYVSVADVAGHDGAATLSLCATTKLTDEYYILNGLFY